MDAGAFHEWGWILLVAMVMVMTAVVMMMMIGKDRKDPVLEGIDKKSCCLTSVGLDTAASDSDDRNGNSDDSNVTVMTAV